MSNSFPPLGSISIIVYTTKCRQRSASSCASRCLTQGAGLSAGTWSTASCSVRILNLASITDCRSCTIGLCSVAAFNQTEMGRQQGGKGTGLGLALVRQIVKLSGGRLGVQSKAGRGSVFWVELRECCSFLSCLTLIFFGQLLALERLLALRL